jgi:hypothetical protein
VSTKKGEKESTLKLQGHPTTAFLKPLPNAKHILGAAIFLLSKPKNPPDLVAAVI